MAGVGARRQARRRDFGLLTGGAVAICGASAALAIAAVLPDGPEQQRATVMTVVGVTALSTVAMILYPLIAAAAGLDTHTTGIFLGATIHDVAQVVGAGYSVSAEAGDTATIVKLFRVALLLPVVLVLSLIVRNGAGAAPSSSRPPLLPVFLVAFARSSRSIPRASSLPTLRRRCKAPPAGAWSSRFRRSA